MLPPLPALAAFEAIARRRSFAAAAAELHLTPSAVSHQVARLEGFLGVRLFERSSKGVQLSPAGEAYLQRVAGAIGAITAATDALRQGVRNSLYVHSSPSFASLWLMPRINHFAQAHPGITLYLSSSPQHSDFELGQVDVDIRYGLANWPQLQVRPIFSESVLPLASPAFIERYGLRSTADLLQVPLIQSTVNVVQWSDWLAVHDPQRRVERYALRFDRAMMALDAAAQGMGVALESAAIGAPYLRDGRLRAPWGLQRAVTVQAHFVVFPASHAHRPEVARFLDWIAAEAQAGTAP